MTAAIWKTHMTSRPGLLILCAWILSAFLVPPAGAAPVKYQVTGLFATEREQDLREVFAALPQLKLVSIDFPNAEVLLDFEAQAAFPKAKANEILQAIDTLVKKASYHTFGIKPPRTVPLARLKLIEIPVAGLDCKACCLAAYESIYKLEGVERATASFRTGLVTAHVDPAKIDRAALEAALKKKGVQLKSP